MQPLDLDKGYRWGENSSENLSVRTVYYKIDLADCIGALQILNLHRS